MMNKGLALAAAGVLLLAFVLGSAGWVSLGGVEDSQGFAGADRLIGVFITRDCLDALGSDFQTHTGIDGMTRIRLEAKQVFEECPSSDGGTVLMPNYLFEGAEGLAMYAPTVFIDGDPCFTNRIDPGLGEVKTGIHEQDQRTDLSLEGTLWLAEGGGLTSLILNPVYQSEDGSVYALTGNGADLSDMGENGIETTMNLSEETNWQFSGETRGHSAKITVHFKSMPEFRTYTLTQFGEDNTVLSSDNFLPGEAPESIKPLPDTAFMVLEQTNQRDGSVTRTLHQRGDSYLTTFTARPDGLCVPASSDIIWEE